MKWGLWSNSHNAFNSSNGLSVGGMQSSMRSVGFWLWWTVLCVRCYYALDFSLLNMFAAIFSLFITALIYSNWRLGVCVCVYAGLWWVLFKFMFAAFRQIETPYHLNQSQNRFFLICAKPFYNILKVNLSRFLCGFFFNIFYAIECLCSIFMSYAAHHFELLFVCH